MMVLIGWKSVVGEDGVESMKTFTVEWWREVIDLQWERMVWIWCRSSVLEDDVDMIDTFGRDMMETWSWEDGVDMMKSFTEERFR
jgi:hypothetical protein